MPGTTSNGTPCSASSSSSSPPRPNMNGSPPFRRTTLLPARASSSSTWLICSWGIVWFAARLPTSIVRTPRGTSASTPSPTSASYTTTSACASTAAPLRVNKPTSPGPAPTSHTLPILVAASSMFVSALSGWYTPVTGVYHLVQSCYRGVPSARLLLHSLAFSCLQLICQLLGQGDGISACAGYGAAPCHA